uniref:protein-glutamine gamma-glutamyltransferase n=2 Tax=Lepisosteus oculatus TaxID=7918 RepID=W5N165_LEPOC
MEPYEMQKFYKPVRAMSTPETRPQHSQATHTGRSNIPSVSSNAEGEDIPEFEPFGLHPRGRPNLRDFLDVWDMNMLKTRDEINKKEHRTHLYNNDNLIVRRGQQFQIKITFNREYNPAKDKFWVEFLIGRYPQGNKGTYVAVSPNQDQTDGQWGARVLGSEGSIVTLGITPAPDCIVGKFRLYVAVMTPYGIRRTRRDPQTDTYILFNPWAPDDSVYMGKDGEIEEYVLNEAGIIYFGEASEVESRPWNFGQFEYGVLDACLFIMDKAQMPLTGRGNPVKVSRVASAMVNAKDDDGVIVGNWSGDYLYGVAPTAWTGSVEILLNYASGGMPVCYGQCWVFAAVFNTFLRCLGIPARVVTNFFSAHDNDGNLKTDAIVDEDGKLDRNLTKDSVWNYHCWNECWMTRSDLPEGFGGWQAVDATPQETSDGMYRCGPASVHAIKQGRVYLPFDTPFVFAEVNSDVVYWKRKKDGTQEVVKVDPHHMGKMILTKEVGRDESKDVTDLYKFPEGSEEERLATEAAVAYGLKKAEIEAPVTEVDIAVNVQDVQLGSDFILALEFKNKTPHPRTMVIHVSGNIVYYTGVTHAEFKSLTKQVTVKPGETKTVDVEVKSQEYLSHLVEQAMLNFFITGRVNETNQILTAQRVLTLQVPKLTVKVSGIPRVNEQMFVTVEFTNPVKFNLDNVNMRMEGAGLLRTKVKNYSIIPPNSSLTWTESFVPSRPGRSKIIVSLDCNTLRQVYGQAELSIDP